MLQQDLSTLTAQIQALIKDIGKERNHINGQWLDNVDKAYNLAEKLHQELINISKDKINLISVLETPAVDLWNYTVALKTKNTISAVTNAKLRNISFQLVDCCTANINEENAWKKKIMMGMKAGKAWLECKEPTKAEQVFLTTDQFIAALQKTLVDIKNENGSNEQLERQKIESLKDVFKLLCLKSESALLQDDHQRAMDMILLAKEMLPNFPKEGGYLSMLSYNFGVDMYQKSKYEESIMWLRESFELGKGRQTIGPKNQARTLRLLANAYMELNAAENHQKALNAVTLANTEFSHSAGLYLRLKILLVVNEEEAVIQKATEDVLRQTDLSVDSAQNVVQLLVENKCTKMAVKVLKDLMKMFEHSPDLGKLLVSQFEILTQISPEKEAKDFVELCITAHNTGKPLDNTTSKRFHLIIWEQAGRLFEAKSYQESLEWYNYSLSFFNHNDTDRKNLAKLYRNIAHCYFNVGQMEKAREAAEQAHKWESESIHTHFILFKLALAMSDNEKAKESLQKMCGLVEREDYSTDAHGIICLAAQMALESSEPASASMALECLANSSKDNWQALTAHRCLIRLKLDTSSASHDFTIIEKHILAAYNKLLQLKEQKEASQLSNEACWFMKIAWNVALQCDENPSSMKELFSLCFKLSSLCVPDDNSFTRQKTCLLMASAAGLQVARTSYDETEKKYCLEEALHHVRECRRVEQRLQLNSPMLTTENKGKDTTHILLLLYEFEARVKLNDPQAEQVLEQALKLPNPDPKTFETLAALAMEPPAHNKSVSVRALKVAIRKHLQVPQPDFKKSSKLFHSLVHLALSGSVDTGTKEEALNYYSEIIDIIQKRAQNQYPEMEVLWLMTKAWNCGINFFSSGRYDDAEKWCSTSMKLLTYLDTMRNNYEEHMNTTYSEILDRMERLKAKGKYMEE